MDPKGYTTYDWAAGGGDQATMDYLQAEGVLAWYDAYIAAGAGVALIASVCGLCFCRSCGTLSVGGATRNNTRTCDKKMR